VRLKQALQRLQSTVVLTTIRHGENWRRMQFSWINEWEELVDARGHCHGVEFVLPEWFYRGVLDRSLVLTIDPAYFALTGGIERWLYRVARRHAGHQPKGWAFELRHLHAKSGSAARFSDFALDLRRIAARQTLPGYDLFIELDNTRELLRVVPRRLSTGTVYGSVEPIRRSGARIIRRSGARLSADQAHHPQLTFWPTTRNGALNDSNSRLFCCWRPKGRYSHQWCRPIATGEAAMIAAMLNQKRATGKSKPALNFATDLAREGLCALVKLASSACGLSVTKALRVRSNSSVPKRGDNIGAPQ